MTIPVTKPFLPPQSEYQSYVDGIWQREWLTNHGPLVTRLEDELQKELGVSGLVYVSNGTIALQLAIKALRLKGKVITTAFSYVATTSSLVWEGCEPVMADIDPHSLNIDPRSIERLITEDTTGIMATHVYGNPCDVDAIEKIAGRHNLKVIYDGAHAFGTKVRGKSVFEFGDASTASFHATKLFHTVEGGAVMSSDKATVARVSELRNFGHVSSLAFGEAGINGKNSEFHAAMGLCNLKYIRQILEQRKSLSLYYEERLSKTIQRPRLLSGASFNFAYYPILLQTAKVCERVVERLNQFSIYPRRYFFPALSALPYVLQEASTPISVDAASRVLCLPLYHTLSFEEIDLVARLVNEEAESSS